MAEFRDLFEFYEELPPHVLAIIDSYDEEKELYKECARVQKEFQAVGYTCDYGLCGEPYHLRRINDIANLKLVRDSESINIFIDNGEDYDPLHVIYWHVDEWLEDAESVVPAIMEAMELFYTDKKKLLNKLNISFVE